MTWLSAIIMGLVQGIAEFLPISSSGHLAIAEHLLNMQGASEIPQFYDVLLHLGTLVAVFIAYWDEIYDMIVEFFAGVGDLVHHTTPRVVPPARRMILLVIVGTLPLFVMVPFRHFFEGLSDNMYFIGGALLFTGVLLFVSDRVRRGGKTEKTARLSDALVVGIGQAIALCPGVSRSGMTITTGCFVGFERKFAVRFSFILSIPEHQGRCRRGDQLVGNADVSHRRSRCRGHGLSLHPAAENDRRPRPLRRVRLLLLDRRRAGAHLYDRIKG